VDYRVVGELSNSDIVVDRTFWVGVYPGVTDEMTDFVGRTIQDFVTAASR
jgi:CDP-6-deoxy-D-xylo-4-hexulose-3-dehydrase